jgi:hypothetical protein
MHGWPRASSRTRKHHQLPLGTNAKVHDRAEEAEVKRKRVIDGLGRGKGKECAFWASVESAAFAWMAWDGKSTTTV